MTSRIVGIALAATASVLVFACAATTDDVVIGTRPDPPVFGSSDGGDASVAPDARDTRGLCPTNECPPGRATCADSPFPCGVDLTSDDENCGACGNACPVVPALNVRAACIDGACRFGCTSQFADCNGLPDDGCETIILSDKNNCGGCGVKCADICTNGKCGCSFGETFCGTFCADLKVNPENCGTCGNVCPPSSKPPLPQAWNAVYSLCNAGQCNELPACKGPYGDCDDDLGDPDGNGCETNLRDDAQHCGACGNACAPGEACVFGKCECECGSSCYHVTNDIDNCGACHAPCPGSRDEDAHGAPVCNGGVCDYKCDVDWGDCDGLASSGCEVNLRSDPLNCGGCGIRCTAVEGQACVDGHCTMKECEPR